MTKEQAEAFIEQVAREEPRIEASLEDNAKVRRGDNGFRVRLYLAAGQRVLYVNYPDQWESIKAAWCWFLPGLEVAVREAARPKNPTYLVDGIPMRIYQLRTRGGYWIGNGWSGGKMQRKFFGKDDPRGRYPIVEESLLSPEVANR